MCTPGSFAIFALSEQSKLWRKASHFNLENKHVLIIKNDSMTKNNQEIISLLLSFDILLYVQSSLLTLTHSYWYLTSLWDDIIPRVCDCIFWPPGALMSRVCVSVHIYIYFGRCLSNGLILVHVLDEISKWRMSQCREVCVSGTYNLVNMRTALGQHIMSELRYV